MDPLKVLGLSIVIILMAVVLFIIDLSNGYHEYGGHAEIVSENFKDGSTYTTVDSKGRVGVAYTPDEFKIFIRDLDTNEILEVSSDKQIFFNHKEGDKVEYFRYYGWFTGIHYGNAIK